MAYKGLSPNLGLFHKLDDISSSFDGSDKTFSLTLGGKPYITTNAYTLLVVLNGAVQEPVAAFTINRDEITFTSAPAASPTSFYIMSLGNTFHTGGMKSISVWDQSGTKHTIPVHVTTLPVIGRSGSIPVLINPA